MIEVETVDDIVVLTLSHGKVNALDIEFCEALAARFAELRSAKAVVMKGQGRAFSAGVDLIRLSEGGADYVRRFLPVLHKLYETIVFHPRPVVAAINGHAIAGGCLLAACADRRVMGRGQGRIGVTELQVGLPFPSLAFAIVRAAVPARYLAEVIYSGATYESDAALERGWIDQISEPGAVVEDALAIARELSALSPAAFAQTKQQMRQPIADAYAKDGRAVDRTVTDIWCEPASLGYIRAYVARTLKKG